MNIEQCAIKLKNHFSDYPLLRLAGLYKIKIYLINTEKTTNTSLLFTSIPFLEELNTLFENLPEKAYTFVIDLAHEAVFEKHPLEIKQQIRAYAKKNATKIYVINGSTSYCEERVEYAKIVYIGIDYLLFNYAHELQTLGKKTLNKALYDQAGHTIKIKKRSKVFMCLNLMPKAHRYAIVIALMKIGALDKTCLSFFGEDFVDNSDITKKEDKEYLYNDVIPFLSAIWPDGNYKDELKELQSRKSINCDLNKNTVTEAMWTANRTLDFLLPQYEIDGKTYGSLPHDEAYIQIVTESWFTGPECNTITEKTLRPILYKQPFILISNPYALKRLRELGFKTFSPYIDESYDEEEDPVKRMRLIIREIERLNKLNDEEIHTLYQQCYINCEHNYNLLFNRRHWKVELQKQAIDVLKNFEGYTYKQNVLSFKAQSLKRKSMDFLQRIKHKIKVS